MIPKILTALISAALLSAILGALPCEATSLKQHGKGKAAPAATAATQQPHNFNTPSTDFSGVKPVIDNPQPDLIRPKKEKDQYFD